MTFNLPPDPPEDEHGYELYVRDKHIKELEAKNKSLHEALKPFSHADLCRLVHANTKDNKSLIFQRGKAILRIKHFRKARKLVTDIKEKVIKATPLMTNDITGECRFMTAKEEAKNNRKDKKDGTIL